MTDPEKSHETIWTSKDKVETFNITNYKRLSDGKYRMKENSTWSFQSIANDNLFRVFVAHLDVDQCSTDHLSVFQGDSVQLSGLRHRFCNDGHLNSAVGKWFEIQSPSIVIQFYTNNLDDHKGDGFEVVVLSAPIDTEDSDTLTFILSIVGGVLGLVGVCLFALLFVKFKRDKILKEQQRKNLINEILKEAYQIEKESFENILMEMGSEKFLAMVKELNIPSDKVQLSNISNLDEELTQGHFSTVRRGHLVNRDDDNAEGERVNEGVQGREIVVKCLLPNGSREDEIMAFLREAAIQYQLKHENLMPLLGITVIQEIPHLVFDFMKNGNLKEYLRNHSSDYANDGQKGLMQFCFEISQGMAYLHSKNILHCDLATRNVLVSAEKVAKITDFGLAKEMESENLYRAIGESENQSSPEPIDCPLPIRWAAPELFHLPRIITVKSDIWSFAIVCWEIFTRLSSFFFISSLQYTNIFYLMKTLF